MNGLRVVPTTFLRIISIHDVTLLKNFFIQLFFSPEEKKKNFKQKYPHEQQLVSCSVPALCLTADFARDGPRT